MSIAKTFKLGNELEIHRLGYGAGFYDRTLAALRTAGPVAAVGIAYGAQQVDAVPIGDHDERLDLILTERGFI